MSADERLGRALLIGAIKVLAAMSAAGVFAYFALKGMLS